MLEGTKGEEQPDKDRSHVVLGMVRGRVKKVLCGRPSRPLEEKVHKTNTRQQTVDGNTGGRTRYKFGAEEEDKRSDWCRETKICGHN